MLKHDLSLHPADNTEGMCFICKSSVMNFQSSKHSYTAILEGVLVKIKHIVCYAGRLSQGIGVPGSSYTRDGL